MKFQIGKLVISWGLEECRKIKFPKEIEAIKYAERVRFKYGWIRYHYYCQECKAWHLTKMPQGIKQCQH